MIHFGSNLGTLMANPHLRYSVILIAALEVGMVWLPGYKTQFEATQKIVMFYAMAAAANSGPGTKPPSEPPQNPPTSK